MTSVFSIETIEKKQISQSTFLNYIIFQFVLLKIMYFFWTASDVACRITSNIFPRYFLKNPWTKQGIYDDLSRFFLLWRFRKYFFPSKITSSNDKTRDLSLGFFLHSRKYFPLKSLRVQAAPAFQLM